MPPLTLQYDIKNGRLIVIAADKSELGYVELTDMVYQMDPRTDKLNVLLTLHTDYTALIAQQQTDRLLNGDTKNENNS